MLRRVTCLLPLALLGAIGGCLCRPCAQPSPCVTPGAETSSPPATKVNAALVMLGTHKADPRFDDLAASSLALVPPGALLYSDIAGESAAAAGQIALRARITELVASAQRDGIHALALRGSEQAALCLILRDGAGSIPLRAQAARRLGMLGGALAQSNLPPALANEEQIVANEWSGNTEYRLAHAELLLALHDAAAMLLCAPEEEAYWRKRFAAPPQEQARDFWTANTPPPPTGLAQGMSRDQWSAALRLAVAGLVSVGGSTGSGGWEVYPLSSRFNLMVTYSHGGAQKQGVLERWRIEPIR